MLRGTTSAAFSLEQSTDATGAVQQVKQIQPLIITNRVLIQDTQARGAATVDVNVNDIALAAAQLYPFVTEKASSRGGGDGDVPKLAPLEATQLYQDELDTKKKKTNNVELPLDPLDPTWERPNDRDRTLNAAADFGVPSRLLLQNNNNNDEKSIAMLSGVSAITTMAAESDLLQQQLPMLLVGGLVAFVVAGVVVNRVRRSSENKNKQKACEDIVFDDDDNDGDNEEGYALIS